MQDGEDQLPGYTISDSSGFSFGELGGGFQKCKRFGSRDMDVFRGSFSDKSSLLTTASF